MFFFTPSTAILSYRNRVRNGAMTINQRAVTGTVNLSAGAYGHDGWKAGASGCTYTFAASGGVTTLTITAGSLIQVIEGGLYLPEGGTYTLSWQGSAQGRVNAGAYAASPLVTAGLTAGSNATIEFGTGTLTRVQLEPGSTATPFEWRDDELRRCRRYFRSTYTAGQTLGGASQGGSLRRIVEMATSNATLGLQFDFAMRAGPTVIFYSPVTGASGQIGVYEGTPRDAPFISQYIDANGIFGIVSTSAISANTIIGVHLTASAEL